MVSSHQQTDVMLMAHRGQRVVTRKACSLLGAMVCDVLHDDLACIELHPERFGFTAAMGQPLPGIRAQPVMYVECVKFDPNRAAMAGGDMQ